MPYFILNIMMRSDFWYKMSSVYKSMKIKGVKYIIEYGILYTEKYWELFWNINGFLPKEKNTTVIWFCLTVELTYFVKFSKIWINVHAKHETMRPFNESSSAYHPINNSDRICFLQIYWLTQLTQTKSKLHNTLPWIFMQFPRALAFIHSKYIRHFIISCCMVWVLCSRRQQATSQVWQNTLICANSIKSSKKKQSQQHIYPA